MKNIGQVVNVGPFKSRQRLIRIFRWSAIVWPVRKRRALPLAVVRSLRRQTYRLAVTRGNTRAKPTRVAI